MFDDVTTVRFDPRSDDPHEGGLGRRTPGSMLWVYLAAFCRLMGGGLLFRSLTTGF